MDKKDNDFYKEVMTKKEQNKRLDRLIVPFISGLTGSLVLVISILSIPSLRNKIVQKLTSEEKEKILDNSIATSSSSAQISLEEYSKTSMYVANKVLPSVVGIKVTYSVNSPFYNYYGMSAQTDTATGSGVIISEDGYILTNNHVVSSQTSSSYYQVSQATTLTVTLYNDDTEYEAQLVGTDEQTDLAVLKIEKDGLTAAELGDSSKIQVGEFAMAIGNPLNMPSTVTTGVISATERTITSSDNTTYRAIQTDAAINAGNSGGALINSEGKVIGINTLKLSGTGIEGIGFAIPINDTIKIYQELITNGKVIRPQLGITGRNVTEEIAKQNNIKQAGIYIISVQEFSSAEKGGIERGDLIIKFNGQEITTMEELTILKNECSIGDKVKIVVIRNNEEKELTLTLEE